MPCGLGSGDWGSSTGRPVTRLFFRLMYLSLWSLLELQGRAGHREDDGVRVGILGEYNPVVGVSPAGRQITDLLASCLSGFCFCFDTMALILTWHKLVSNLLCG